MLDNAFGIFNNVPPRFQWTEIDVPFPGDDQCFRAANYNELVFQSRFPQLRMKIKDAFLILFSPIENADQDLQVLRSGNLTALDMQMLIHCRCPRSPNSPLFLLHKEPNEQLVIYTHFWALTFSNPLASLPTADIPTLVAPFKTAMRNWKVLWDDIKSSAKETEWNKLGYQRTACTYYDAVMQIIGVFERLEGRIPSLVMESDCKNRNHLKRVLSL